MIERTRVAFAALAAAAFTLLPGALLADPTEEEATGRGVGRERRSGLRRRQAGNRGEGLERRDQGAFLGGATRHAQRRHPELSRLRLSQYWQARSCLQALRSGIGVESPAPRRTRVSWR